jgi:hypothetical protein
VRCRRRPSGRRCRRGHWSHPPTQPRRSRSAPRSDREARRRWPEYRFPRKQPRLSPSSPRRRRAMLCRASFPYRGLAFCSFNTRGSVTPGDLGAGGIFHSLGTSSTWCNLLRRLYSSAPDGLCPSDLTRSAPGQRRDAAFCARLRSDFAMLAAPAVLDGSAGARRSSIVIEPEEYTRGTHVRMPRSGTFHPLGCFLAARHFSPLGPVRPRLGRSIHARRLRSERRADAANRLGAVPTGITAAAFQPGVSG